MKIAVNPDPSQWVIVPAFPPPGWIRDEARRRSIALGVTGPRWRAELEALLADLLVVERRENLARLLHIDDASGTPFVVDLSLVRAGDDGTKAGRHATQKALVERFVPGAVPERQRPGPTMAGFCGFATDPEDAVQGVVVLRLAGLPTVPVDLVMRLWGASAKAIRPYLTVIVGLGERVVPAEG